MVSKTEPKYNQMSSTEILREVYTKLSTQSQSSMQDKKNSEKNELKGEENNHTRENPQTTQNRFDENESISNSDGSCMNLRGRKVVSSVVSNEERSDTNSRKRRRSKTEENGGELSYFEWDESLMNEELPYELHSTLATSIFELGLRNSSPKVLKKLMKSTDTLNTEHIKSHLQKYRLHYSRSKEEFSNFYDNEMKDKFNVFCSGKMWQNLPSNMPGKKSVGKNFNE